MKTKTKRILALTVSLSCGLSLFLADCWNPASVWGGKAASLSLSEAVGKSLLYNKNIQAAHHEDEAAKGAKLEAYSAYLPQLNIQSQSAKTRSDRYTSPFREAGFSGKIFSNKIEATQLIFDRSIISNIFLSGLKKQAAAMQLNEQKRQSVAETIKLYIEVLLAGEIIDIQRQRLELAEKQLHTAKSNFQAGYQIDTDVARARLTQASARRDINLAKVSMERAEVSLNQIMGMSVNMQHEVTSGYLVNFDPSAMPAVELNLDTLFEVAQSQNPAIQLAELLVKQQEKIHKMAKGEFYPRLYASGNWGYYDTEKMDFEDEEWNLQLICEIPLFEGGRRFGKVKRTLEKLKAEKKRYENVILEIHGQIEESLFIMREERNNYKIAVKAEVVAEKNYEVFFNLYESGMTESLDLIQALTDLESAKTEVVIARYNYLRGVVQLLSALGKLPLDQTFYEGPTWLNISQFLAGHTKGAE